MEKIGGSRANIGFGIWQQVLEIYNTISEIGSTILYDDNRFAANWISKKTFSKESEDLLIKGKEIYKFYYSHLNELNTKHYKIETWDAGWWQIRNAIADQNLGSHLFEELKQLHTTLREKILPQIYGYGFI